jgi:AmmeMemoRadiSam system protein B
MAEERLPAVAGRFYSSDPEVLSRELQRYLAPLPTSADTIQHAIGCVVPHAGYMYSGRVAGAVYRKLPQRSSHIILGPNHFGVGAPLAINAEGTWVTPLGEARIDTPLARALMRSCHLLSEDAVAHAQEHSLEVQIPFLQHVFGGFSFVPIAIGSAGYPALEMLGRVIAGVVSQAQNPVLIIASSDMNHYESDDVTREKDSKAIERVLALDPLGLYEVVRREEISMCGFGPTVALLIAARQLGTSKAELVKYATSGDVSGDRDSVVGYAGMVLS